MLIVPIVVSRSSDLLFLSPLVYRCISLIVYVCISLVYKREQSVRILDALWKCEVANEHHYQGGR